jgi:hypothetical protein
MNRVTVLTRLIKNGKTQVWLAKELGISYQALNYKLRDFKKFTKSEKVALEHIFKELEEKVK